MSPAAFWPTLTFELGLDAPALQASSLVAWTDITASVRSARWEWGRQHELNRFEPGRCTLTVDDKNRDFDTANTASPYNGKLTPLRRLRVRAVWASVTYELWQGFVLSFPRSWLYGRSAELTIEAVDALGILNLWPVWGSPFEQVVRDDSPTAWLRLGDAANNVAGDSAGNGFTGTLQGAPQQGDSLVSGDSTRSLVFEFATDERVSVPRTDMIDRFPFTIELMMSTTTDRAYLKALLAGIGGPTLPIAEQLVLEVIDSGTSAPNAGKIGLYVATAGSAVTITSGPAVDGATRHHIVAQMDSPSVGRVYVDGVDTSTSTGVVLPRFPAITNGWAIGNSPALGFTQYDAMGPVQDVAIYNGVTLSSTRVSAHATAALTGWDGDDTGARINRILDEIGWSASDRSIAVGKSKIGPTLQRGGALDYLQALDATEYGAFFADHANGGKLTFQHRHEIMSTSLYTTSQFTLSDSDSTADVHYEPPAIWGVDHADIRNLAVVTRAGGSTQVAKDAASITAYGQRELPVSVLHSSDAQAKDLAQWLVSQFAQPATRVRQVQCYPQFNAANDWPKVLGAKMRQRVTFTASPPGGSTFIQESHIERIAHEVTPDEWKVTFDLSAVDTQSYWQLGTSALGTTTRLGY